MTVDIVLGSTGRYGKRFTEELIYEGRDVLVAQRHSGETPKQWTRAEHLRRWYKVDLEYPSSSVALVTDIVRKNLKVSSVYHFAVDYAEGKEPHPLNVDVALNVNVLSVLYLSYLLHSSDALANKFRVFIPMDENSGDKSSIYWFSKAILETGVRSYFDKLKLNAELVFCSLPPVDECPQSDIHNFLYGHSLQLP